MWVPKYVRDEKKGVDSPIPTQVVSNEEILPRPQSRDQAHVEQLIGDWGERNAKKVGMKRRDFMRTSMGMATAFMASNEVFGPYWEVEAQEQFEPQATAEKYPKSEYFIIDVQSHFTNNYAVGFRGGQSMRNMGFDLSTDKDAYSLPNFVKEMFFDSETAMVVLSGVPSKERNSGEDGRVLEGLERARGLLPSWLMARAKKEINEVAGSQRALSQGNCAPNHYWDEASNKQDLPALFEQMEREVKLYGIDSWKWYCHTDPYRANRGFQLDDELSANFYEQSRKLGVNLFSVHKGYSNQSRTLGHLANPKDVEKAALDNPDFNFVIYHSALKHGPSGPNAEELLEWDPTTGDFLWHNVLIDIKKRNPDMNNVYPEIGSAFGSLVTVHPAMCQHLMGKNIKYYGVDHVVWGTDCLWWGSPQWVIDAWKRFQFTDEMSEKFGYAKLTKEDKAKVFGLNAAKLYGVDPEAKRNAMPADALSKFKLRYTADGGTRSNMYPGWVRAEA